MTGVQRVLFRSNEFQRYIKSIHCAYKCLGTSKKKINFKVRKTARLNGIFSKKTLVKNTILKKKDIKIKSPALGLRQKELKLILGKKLKITVKRDKPLIADFFK